MSGGERKKRIGGRGLGWEEAGAEFYQESYPGADVDLEALPRDPHYFTTLLPSKQNRAATSKRQRGDTKTFKRRTSTRSRHYNTMGQNTVQADLHVSMMPDLSENLANEESTWEEIMLIKAMPVSMAQKKEMKAKLLSAETFRLQGLKQFKWQHRKLWEYLKMRRKELHKSLELWRSCFKKIEGNFGTGIATYFRFLKWLMFLNLSITVLMVCFVVVPTLIFQETQNDECLPSNETNSLECCSSMYFEKYVNVTWSPIDILTGTGWLEASVLFYGIYPSSTLEDTPVTYNLPMAYIATVLGYFLLSLFALLENAASGFKERIIESEGQYYKYCNMVFAGWDFCLYNEKSACIRHRALYYEMKESLDVEKREEEKKNRTREEVCRSLLLRFLVNVVVIVIVIGTSSAVFFVFQFSEKELKKESFHELYSLFLQYAPALCVVILSSLVPHFFNYLSVLENYGTVLTDKISLLRAMLIRVSLLGILLVSLHNEVNCQGNTCPPCGTPMCWETYIGQHIYKLLLTDFSFQFLVAIFIYLPKMLLSRHSRCVRKPEFYLANHLLDAAYTQTLIWFGGFYAPLLPALGTVLFFFMFYIKKFACLVNSSPPAVVYTTSKADSMFVTVLLMCFTVASLPWGFGISEVEPSRSCGPFRGKASVWSVVQEAYSNLPLWFRLSVDNLTTPVCILPVLLVLILVLYYYFIVAKANKQMVAVLKKQLILEGHDKQFLLNRLSAFIKQQQERHKAMRSVDPTTAAST